MKFTRQIVAKFPALSGLSASEFSDMVYWVQCPSVPGTIYTGFKAWGDEIHARGELLQDHPITCMAWGNILRQYSFFHLSESEQDYIQEFLELCDFLEYGEDEQ